MQRSPRRRRLQHQEGDPGYRPKLDRDNHGAACEG
ncbi:excalibur calcium-binding domain-containing protein [Mycobacteroides saopaulense]|nr:excalibur calcium-binding domain-containing protein [Mycobacteroides saopaulense]